MNLIANSCQQLTRLYLKRAVNLTAASLIPLSLLPNLIDFDLHECPRLNDQVLKDIHATNGFSLLARFAVTKCNGT